MRESASRTQVLGHIMPIRTVHSRDRPLPKGVRARRSGGHCHLQSGAVLVRHRIRRGLEVNPTLACASIVREIVPFREKMHRAPTLARTRVRSNLDSTQHSLERALSGEIAVRLSREDPPGSDEPTHCEHRPGRGSPFTPGRGNGSPPRGETPIYLPCAAMLAVLACLLPQARLKINRELAAR